MIPDEKSSFEDLFAKYHALLTENSNLKEEIRILKTRLGGVELRIPVDERSGQVGEPETTCRQPVADVLLADINNKSGSGEKIKLFMSLFKGRDDVYARRWENKKKGTSGYSPSCVNEWKPGVCIKQKGSCASCIHKKYAELDETAIDQHLRGKIIAGIYLMGLDDTCWFLAIDFDEGEWRKDISALRDVCAEFEIHVAVEQSRSGNGAHAWLFFERPIPAVLARKLGASMVTYTMNKRHEITFKSYDRFFPNQDTLPKGGLGNLIALPLQKEARKLNNSEFIDENLVPYGDQWTFLGTVRRLTEDEVERLISKLSGGNELGVLRTDEEETQKPWETVKIQLKRDDFPRKIEIVKANMLYVSKAGLSQRGLNRLKRLAAFQNPEFYKAQAMRLPTYGKPRIVSCAGETDEYLCLPRGCEIDLKAMFSEQGTEITCIDNTTCGKKIDIEFIGTLRDEQPLAIDQLLSHDIGVLSGTTAFGKTVVAIKLIAERKVNTLIIVNRASLVSQWTKRLMEFLAIRETLPATDTDGKKRSGRKKIRTVIGQLGQGKTYLAALLT